MKKVFICIVILLFSMCTLNHARSFKKEQQKYSRVRGAYKNQEISLKEEFLKKQMSWPPEKIFFRVFKLDKVFEVWVEDKKSNEYILFNSYPICALSGTLGPKRKQGDFQIPEGFYSISVFNPVSSYHLSLKVNYPNASDLILGVKGNLGGDIFVHGACVTIGCIPLTDEIIEKIYVLAVESKNKNHAIPIHIFPTHLTQENMIILENNKTEQMTNILRVMYEKLMRKNSPQSLSKKVVFWKNLKPIYDYFERTHNLPNIKVKQDGSYDMTN